MPPPVILLVVLMIGYPLVQIAAIGLRRKKRLRFNAIVEDLLADPGISDSEKNTIRTIERDSRGGLASLWASIGLPTAAFAAAFEGAERVAVPGARLFENDALEQLSNDAIDLELATHPIASAVLLPLAMAAWCIGAGVALLKGASTPSLPTFHDLVRAATPLRFSPSMARSEP